MRKTYVALLLPLAFVLAGCFDGTPEFSEAEQVPESQRATAEGEGDDAAGGNGEGAPSVRFVAVDIDFEEAPAEVPAGLVEFELVNDGNARHNVVLDDLGNELVVEADGGETAVGSIELEPGEYAYHCDIPGHEQAMSGTFTVTD
jgi:plastocyanin